MRARSRSTYAPRTDSINCAGYHCPCNRSGVSMWRIIDVIVDVTMISAIVLAVSMAVFPNETADVVESAYEKVAGALG